MKELVGKLARTSMNSVDYTICMYYDEAITLDECLDWLRADLEDAKKYRDAYFLKFAGEQLPEQGFGLTDEDQQEASEARHKVDPEL